MHHSTRRLIMGTTNGGLFIPLWIFFLFSISVASTASDTITGTQTITDRDTIVSSDGSFEMGFFSPGTSKNRYLGVWYKNLDTKAPVWVANRETPLTDSSGVLKVRPPGILVLLNSTNQVIWSSNTSASVENPVAQLLDTGNLVVRKAGDGDPGNFLWQSFDHPGNTIIAGMKIGKSFVTGREWYLTSWKSEDDPSPGDYTYRMDANGYPQLFMRKGGEEVFRTGGWIGDRFSGAPKLKPNIIYRYRFDFTKEEVSYGYVVLNGSALPRRVLSHTGVMQWWTWVERKASWVLYSNGPPTDACDTYASCGAYGSCNVDNSPVCGCLEKFEAINAWAYNSGDWGTGCQRRTPLDCKKGDIFIKYPGIKLPDTRNAWFNTTMTLQECKSKCLQNCSCMAYSNMDFTGAGTGCLLWSDGLMDIRQLGADGQDVFIRMASSEAEASAAGNKRDAIIVGVAVAIPALLICLGLALFIWKKKRRQLTEAIEMRDISVPSYSHETCKEDLELPLFDLDKIIDATGNFSLNNKLGEGGYGTVYKGMLEGKQEIAVKRLARDSRQGFGEFKNEVTYIAKLQHRNLVKLLGCCIQAEEKMLIYEYMPNKSLDAFIFDETRRSLLGWPTRFNIINGIARGLVYLHQDSRLRIIHRDLKASNVLLDIDMNPKIADFGMARCFGGNETTANTKRVVGTYGYMSPEYQLDGIFSVKSDVFSFGVLVLEIIGGQRNRGFYHPDHHLNLLGHAWQLYNEDRSLEMVDAVVTDTCHLYEILRCIHIALLCVQQRPEDRPTMSGVVLMLGGEGALPQPKQPGFFTERNPVEFGGYSSSKGPVSSSTNEITITLLDPR